MQDSVMKYGWYTQKMTEVLTSFKSYFPKADILVLGVPDRAKNENGVYKTMPAVKALSAAQKRMAEKNNVSFLSLYELMGGENSMIDYVSKGWASKDYTHLTYRGGRDIAWKIYNALITEKEFYDKVKTTENEEIF